MQKKMTPAPWKFEELPGGHNWSIVEPETGIHLANVGDAHFSKDHGFLAGTQILANAEAIVSAVNNTYGREINPEAVPDLLAALSALVEVAAGRWRSLPSTSHEKNCLSSARAAITLAKL